MITFFEVSFVVDQPQFIDLRLTLRTFQMLSCFVTCVLALSTRVLALSTRVTALACSALTPMHFPGCASKWNLVDMFILIYRVDSSFGIGKMHWSEDWHEIWRDTHHIHESHTSTSKWCWFCQHPERIYPLGGNMETPDAFCGKRKMHPDARQKFARYRIFFTEK